MNCLYCNADLISNQVLYSLNHEFFHCKSCNVKFNSLFSNVYSICFIIDSPQIYSLVVDFTNQTTTIWGQINWSVLDRSSKLIRLPFIIKNINPANAPDHAIRLKSMIAFS